jgi:hypothetical protein
VEAASLSLPRRTATISFRQNISQKTCSVMAFSFTLYFKVLFKTKILLKTITP